MMFFLNPTNSEELARTIQQDYEREAATYRLLKASGYRPGGALAKTAVALTTLIAAVATAAHFVF